MKTFFFFLPQSVTSFTPVHKFKPDKVGITQCEFCVGSANRDDDGDGDDSTVS